MHGLFKFKGATFPDIAHPGVLAEVMMAAHYVQKGAMEALTKSSGYESLSIVYADYFTRLTIRDHSPGELAEAIGISKQLCSKTIRELEDRKLIERRPNPADSRSRLLSLSAEGHRLNLDGARAADATLRELEDSIGADVLRQIATILEKLCENLALPVFDLPEQVAPRRLNLLLPTLAAYIRKRLGAAIWDQGFDRFGVSAGHVFGVIGPGTSQIRSIASILGISKQAVALAAAELDRLGYIIRLPDPADGRQLVLGLSPRGQELVAAGERSVKAIEDSFKALLGTNEYRRLEDAMAVWYEKVAELYDPAQALKSKVERISGELLTDLGPAGARALADQLMTLTQGKL